MSDKDKQERGSEEIKGGDGGGEKSNAGLDREIPESETMDQETKQRKRKLATIVQETGTTNVDASGEELERRNRRPRPAFQESRTDQETRGINQECRSTSQQPGIEDKNPGIFDLKNGNDPGIFDLKTEMRNQEPGIMFQESRPANEELKTTDEETKQRKRKVSDEEVERRNRRPRFQEPGMSDQETGRGNQECRSTSQQPGVENENPGISDLKTEMRNQEPGIMSQESRPANGEFKTTGKKSTTENKESRSRVQGPVTTTEGSRTSDLETRKENEGPSSTSNQSGVASKDPRKPGQKAEARNQEARTKSQESKPANEDPTTFQESRLSNEESETTDEEAGIKNEEARSMFQKPTTANEDPRNTNQEIKVKNTESCDRTDGYEWRKTKDDSETKNQKPYTADQIIPLSTVQPGKNHIQTKSETKGHEAGSSKTEEKEPVTEDRVLPGNDVSRSDDACSHGRNVPSNNYIPSDSDESCVLRNRRDLELLQRERAIQKSKDTVDKTDSSGEENFQEEDEEDEEEEDEGEEDEELDSKQKVKEWLNAALPSPGTGVGNVMDNRRDSSPTDPEEVKENIEELPSGSNAASAYSSRQNPINEEQQPEECESESSDKEQETDQEIKEGCARTDGYIGKTAEATRANKVKGLRRKRFTKRAPRKMFRTKYLSPRRRLLARRNAKSSSRSRSDPQSNENEASKQPVPKESNVSEELSGQKLSAKECVENDVNWADIPTSECSIGQSVCNNFGAIDHEEVVTTDPVDSVTAVEESDQIVIEIHPHPPDDCDIEVESPASKMEGGSEEKEQCEMRNAAVGEKCEVSPVASETNVSEARDFENIPSGTQSSNSELDSSMVEINVIVETQSFDPESEPMYDGPSQSADIDELIALVGHDETSSSDAVDEFDAIVDRDALLSPVDVPELEENSTDRSINSNFEQNTPRIESRSSNEGEKSHVNKDESTDESGI